MREVAIIGVGMTKFGELWEQSIRDMFAEAALKAMENAKVEKIDALYVGAMSSGLYAYQEHLASLMADYVGQIGVPAVRVESACSSGGQAVRMGYIDVASGMHDIVLVGGVEKMWDVEDGTFVLATASDQEYEAYNGVTFPGLYAMIARAYMERYGLTREELAQVPIKNHKHAVNNPNAQYPFEIDLKTVLNSSMVADPLRLMDCSPITDGAACVILCPLDRAKEFTDKYVKIRGVGAATGPIALHDHKDLTRLEAVNIAAQRAYKMAGVGPEDIDFVEVHDCFSIAEIVVAEELGFFEYGKAGKAIAEGQGTYGGKIVINPSGGLKAKGHPVGATGVAQIIEAYYQLTNQAGKRQVQNARLGMTQNMGGSGGSCVVHILEGM
ncbi:MAG: Acetyl CoA synthase (Acetyl-CoA c-acetyltransferase) [Candidatus Kapaibacterium sp.]|jgi:acetyl-CoA C-acetyltransferase|nr:MAG: Acetyl CoA synthase (Acetyl-CoA c-acetyltransferase) [Candidatus Kapabacteria bacterium]ROL58356.1 MAG: thiolase domain-containing protein [Bacteroidetes/Chlorobi group bacterium Naka2016]